MEFLGVGPLEIFFILILALIILGPKDMVKTGRQLGAFLRKIVRTDAWQAIQQTSRDIRYLPNKLMRESGLEEEVKEIEKIGKDLEASAKDVETSVKEMSESVKKEMDQAVSDLDLTVSVDELEKTAQQINREISSVSSSIDKELHTTVESTPQTDVNEETIVSSDGEVAPSVKEQENKDPEDNIHQTETNTENQ
jgi:Sec-independent protein translocase protein TatA